MDPTLNTRLTQEELAVVRAISDVGDQYRRLGRRVPKWTRAVKTAVGAVGERLGYQVYASQWRFERNGEWMFDLLWSTDKGEILKRLPLVMESEWHPKEILWDFTKLVAARADLRLMVFWAPTPTRADQMLSEMRDQVRHFRGTALGDRYLFCWWTEKPDLFTCRSYVVKSRPTRRSELPRRVPPRAEA